MHTKTVIRAATTAALRLLPTPNSRLLALSVLVSLGGSLHAAEAPASASRMLVSSPERLEERLVAAARDGYRVGRLALPFDRESLSDSVIGVLEPAEAPPQPVILVESDPGRVAKALEGAAAASLALVDITFVRGRFGRTFVAVLEPSGAPAAIRFVRTTGQAREWKELEAAFREGFGLRRVFSLPDPATNATGEVTFVLEAGLGAPDTLIALAFASHESALIKALAKPVGNGFSPIAAWTGATQVSVLLAKRPSDSTPAATPLLDFDPLGSGLDDGPLGCRLIELLAFRDQQVAICEKVQSTPRRASHEDDILDRDEGLTNDPWDLERFDQKLAAWAAEGLRVSEARLRRGGGKLRLWLLATARGES